MMKHKDYLFLVGILTVHLFLLVFLKFTAWPEMLLWPYLWIHKLMPYKDIAIAHTPLLIAVLTLCYKIFGVGILQLKIFTWVLILVFDGLVFWITKKLWNSKTALIAVCTFIFWQLFFDGNGLWFDLFMGIFTFISFYFVQKKKWIWVGVFWVLAFISKQTAVWFLLPIGYMMLDGKWLTFKNILRRPLRGSPFKVASRFSIGATLVMVPFVLLLFIFQLLPSFWNWAIKFGIFILPKAQGQIQLPDLRSLAVAAVPFAIFIPLFLNQKSKFLNLFLWAFAGMLGVYPRFEYFHFQPAVPFLAIASGIVLTSVKNKWTKIFVIVYIFGSIFLFANFFIRNYHEGIRFYEQNVIDVVNYVTENTTPGDKIFVMNWWDNIYALTKTLPAIDPWVPQLSWYQEIPGIQEKEVTDLKDSKPKLILLQDYVDSGLASYVPQEVYNYLMENYKVKEKIDGIEIYYENSNFK